MTDQLSRPVRSPPRRTRREAPQPPTSNNSTDIDTTKKAQASVPPKSRRTGVWGDNDFNVSKDTPLGTTKLSPDTDDDIPVIPDLDELQEEDTASQVAQAPKQVSHIFDQRRRYILEYLINVRHVKQCYSMAVNRVATYKELDSDLFQHSAFASIDDVSLRLLTTRLHPEADIAETDIVWTWDALFSEVMSQLPEQNSPVPAINEDIKSCA